MMNTPRQHCHNGAVGAFGCSLNRRTLLAGLVGFGVTAVLPSRARARSEMLIIRGRLCSLSQVIDGATVEISGKTGDSKLDRQLSAHAFDLARDFGVRPGIRIVLSPANQSQGALATKDTTVPGTQGTVLLGKDLLFRELDQNRRGWGGLAIAGVMAHEFAHIFQFDSGYEQRLHKRGDTVEVIELHADFLAGYHLGLRRQAGAKMDIGAAMDLMHSLGDWNESLSDHHGRPRERQRAVREGFRLGVQEAPTIEEAAEVGAQIARQIARSQL